MVGSQLFKVVLGYKWPKHILESFMLNRWTYSDRTFCFCKLKFCLTPEFSIYDIIVYLTDIKNKRFRENTSRSNYISNLSLANDLSNFYWIRKTQGMCLCFSVAALTNYHRLRDLTSHKFIILQFCGFPGSSVVENLPADAGDGAVIPGLGPAPGEENGNPLQYSCLKYPMDRGAWQATVHGVKKSQTRLSRSLLVCGVEIQHRAPWV